MSEIGNTILEHARETLLLGGVDVIETREIPYGWQLRGADGEIINIYATGKAVAQGRKSGRVCALFAQRPLPAAARPKRPAPQDARQPIAAEPLAGEAVGLPHGWSDSWGPGDVPF